MQITYRFLFIIFIVPYFAFSQSIQLDWEFTNFEVPRIEYLKGSKIKVTNENLVFVNCESNTKYPFYLLLEHNGVFKKHFDIDWGRLPSGLLFNYLELSNINKIAISENSEVVYTYNLWNQDSSNLQRPMSFYMVKDEFYFVVNQMTSTPKRFKNISSSFHYSPNALYVNHSKYYIFADSFSLVQPYIELCTNFGDIVASKEFTPITTTPNVKIEPVIFQRVKDSNFVYVMSPTKESAYTPLGFSIRFLEQRWHNEVVVDISKTQLGIPETDMIEATSMDWNQDFLAISGKWYKTNGEVQEFIFIIDYDGKIRSVQLLDESIHCNQVRFSEKGFLVLAGNKKISTESQQHYVGVYNDKLEFVTEKNWGDSTSNAIRDITRANGANAVVVTGWSGNSVYVAQLDLHTISSVNTNQPVELFSIYPNPTKGSITIQWNSPFNSPIDISIVDYIGGVVYEKQQVSSEISFSTNQLPTGLYQVVIKSGSQTYSKLMSVVR